MPVINLLRTTRDEGLYELLLAKRGKRAGATHLEGDRTNLLYLKHSDHSILWEQRPKPVIVIEEPKPKRKAKAAPKPKKSKEELFDIRSKAKTKQIEDLDGLIARITKPMKKTEIVNLAIDNGHGSYYLVKKHWKKIEGRLLKNKDGLFLNPEQKS